VERVDLPAVSGEMGVLSNHVPTIQQLKPGVVDVLLEGNKSEKIFGKLAFE
jgi:F-type H+-transporting ATPase subunit delta